jgi:hypothetical protein
LEQLLLCVQVAGITPRFITSCIPISLVRVDWCQLYGTWTWLVVTRLEEVATAEQCYLSCGFQFFIMLE